MSTGLVEFRVLFYIGNSINTPVRLLMALFLGLNELICPSEIGHPKTCWINRGHFDRS
ncbi:uncharacterized protein METZ01_LOCUS484321 [marine metagenome]|uniref:Uncharacterized protein n=1 Tax=marine metagenome TaxID=408172 RepID=A0A383CGI6_9ZZZZ